MKWQNLRKNKCPMCNNNLEPRTKPNGIDKYIVCTKLGCQFSVGERRFGELISDMNNQALNHEDEKKV